MFFRPVLSDHYIFIDFVCNDVIRVTVMSVGLLCVVRDEMSVGICGDLSMYGVCEIMGNTTNNTSDGFTNIMSWQQGFISVVSLHKSYNVGTVYFNDGSLFRDIIEPLYFLC